jgi:LysM repeat protein
VSRSRARISRFLIVLLIATVAIASITYFNKARKGPSEAIAAGESHTTLISELPEPDEPIAPPVLVTETPLAPIPPAAATEAPPAPLAMAGGAAGAPVAGASARTPMAPVSSSRPLADARAQMETGDLLAARSILNQALLSRQLSSSDTAQARQLLQEINRETILSPRRFPNDEFGGSYNVRPGELMSQIARQHNVTWQFLGRINGISDPRRLRAGQTLKVIQGPFHAIVTKGTFTLDLYLGEPEQPGSLFIASYPVGLGENDSTPAGVWLVEPQKKLANPTYYSPRGEGVIPYGDPRNPLGTHWIGLKGLEGDAVGKTSYGIHGTIEPESIGKMESMGCIRLLNEDVAVVFDMLVEGQSRVIVRD